MMQKPPDDNNDNEPENTTDDVHGPSQRDIDRSWDGYESEKVGEGKHADYVQKNGNQELLTNRWSLLLTVRLLWPTANLAIKAHWRRDMSNFQARALLWCKLATGGAIYLIGMCLDN